MQILPILSSLRRHRLTAVLLALQVAFTCAISRSRSETGAVSIFSGVMLAFATSVAGTATAAVSPSEAPGTATGRRAWSSRVRGGLSCGLSRRFMNRARRSASQRSLLRPRRQ